MTNRMKLTSLAACAFACALMAFAVVCPRLAWADAAVYTATATPSYTNPQTGAVEDSGGESGQTLGSTMVTGIVQPQALIEDEGNGEVLISVRFYEADQIGDVTVAASADGSSYGAQQEATKLSTDADTNMVDLQLKASTTTPTLRFEMFVTPMGRSVTFFVTFSDLAEGNTAGFAQTIDADALNAAATAASSTPGASEPVASDASGSASDSSSKGVSEFNADGNEVKDGAASNGADSLNYPLIIGIILVVIVVAGVIVYVAVLKPNRAKQDAAAAAAASAAKGSRGAGRE